MFGDFVTLPLPSSSSAGSMPQTFSPQTSVMPEIAAPTAKCSQFLRAISVEPSAPVKTGSAHLHLVLHAVLGLGVDHREQRVVGVADRTVGQPLGAERVARRCSGASSRPGSPCRRRRSASRTARGRCTSRPRKVALEHLAVAAAAVDTSGADTRDRRPRCGSGSTSGVTSLAFGCSRFIGISLKRLDLLVLLGELIL